MGKDSEISWTHHTFNPWWGCMAVSEECDFCYAEDFAVRVGFGEHPISVGKFPIWGKDAGRRFFGEKHWAEPLKWDRAAAKAGERHRVFCGSMCDVMEDRRDLDSARARLYELIEATPNLDWLLLTKRPQNFRRFLPESWLETPRPNVWGMTTVGHEKSMWRIDALKGCPFVITGLSCEPLITDLPLISEYIDGIDLVICGGESGPKARPMHPDWARRLRDECVERGIAFHFKQWGEWLPAGQLPADDVSRCQEFSLGGSWRRVGKKAAGRLLDGREWNEMPEVSR